MQRAKVFRNNIFAGLLTKLNEKEYVFVYDKEYLKLPNKKPISLTLPLQEEEFKSAYLFPFFYNLLAEGKLKDIQCKELRIDKDDDFSRLILTTKENTIGSITIEKDEI
ncbi:HipA N-terminal domain-containing protein [Aliarcobacter butzleri]|uniref:HipA N-terminal domain-containing protein n=1 Tax=Aliarcobacter butzleri TaxID=28197 RepID=UPI00125EE473|nr:HipA N-terminal domain-containing protein [Aliarcobacter butzleri]MCT7574798.1 HipA N-terminal domain-containing protein [Aliarcobacter butzleri]MCT7576764.1 HipA N-terminal domain-containing protein [Aliarcobacter butzleri]MCT7578542.1 HipA N-terminal domain-containing protein [Aliarcobacter butzleri]MCT7593049.1 HipA N-terminal domain-containing protein [Aliarcobacter butzleri]MDK2063500.1 HipA N-terminal domain-containing protein [Aliarcobacter butzleri]